MWASERGTGQWANDRGTGQGNRSVRIGAISRVPEELSRQTTAVDRRSYLGFLSRSATATQLRIGPEILARRPSGDPARNARNDCPHF